MMPMTGGALQMGGMAVEEVGGGMAGEGKSVGGGEGAEVVALFRGESIGGCRGRIRDGIGEATGGPAGGGNIREGFGGEGRFGAFERMTVQATGGFDQLAALAAKGFVIGSGTGGALGGMGEEMGGEMGSFGWRELEIRHADPGVVAGRLEEEVGEGTRLELRLHVLLRDLRGIGFGGVGRVVASGAQ